MADKIMHHVIVDDETYEIVDKYSREHSAEEDKALQRQITKIQTDIEDTVHSEEIRHIVKLMRADYDALPVKQPDTLYIVQDD